MRFLPSLTRGGSRQRLVVLVSMLAVAALAVVSTGALAANPTVNHFSGSGGPFSIDDFCGTGATVDFTFTVQGTEWLTPNQAGYRNTSHGTDTYTNPANGNTVDVNFAGPFTATIVSFNPDGGWTELDTHEGLTEQIKTPQGPRLLQDVGYIQLLVTYDADGNFLGSQIVIAKGPHPDAETGAGCDVITSALGL